MRTGRGSCARRTLRGRRPCRSGPRTGGTRPRLADGAEARPAPRTGVPAWTDFAGSIGAAQDLTKQLQPGKGASVARKILWASLALAPVVILMKWAFSVSDVVLFAAAAVALIPLAWLIGEATEHAGEHTGPGVAGFLNASFGNAPELIIALIAISNGLPEVVRGSITGSIVSNILLVLGFAIVVGPPAEIDRRSVMTQLGLVTFAALLFLVPSVPGFHGDPNRHSLAVLTLPIG